MNFGWTDIDGYIEMPLIPLVELNSNNEKGGMEKLFNESFQGTFELCRASVHCCKQSKDIKREINIYRNIVKEFERVYGKEPTQRELSKILFNFYRSEMKKDLTKNINLIDKDKRTTELVEYLNNLINLIDKKYLERAPLRVDLGLRGVDAYRDKYTPEYTLDSLKDDEDLGSISDIRKDKITTNVEEIIMKKNRIKTVLDNIQLMLNDYKVNISINSTSFMKKYENCYKNEKEFLSKVEGKNDIEKEHIIKEELIRNVGEVWNISKSM